GHGYARGGVLPGFTPGRDVHDFVSPTGGALRLSGGEAIMRPEWTRAVGGAGAVNSMNRAATSGNAGILPGLADLPKSMDELKESMQEVSREIEIAYRGYDWGIAEMERYVGPMVAQAVFDTARAAGSFMRREHDDYIHAKYGDFGNLARSLEIIAAGGPKAWGESAYDVINTAMTRNFNGSAWLQEDSPLVVAALRIGDTLGQWQAQWNQSEVNAELRKSAED